MPKGDAEDLRADLDDGYAKVANLLLEALACAPLTGTEYAVVLFVMRRTYGWAKKRDRRTGQMDAITAEEIADGTASATGTVRRAIQNLVRVGILISEPLEAGGAWAYGINPSITSWGMATHEWKHAKTQLREARERDTYKQKRTGLYAELHRGVSRIAQGGKQNCTGVGTFSPVAPGSAGAPTDITTYRHNDSTDKGTDAPKKSNKTRTPQSKKPETPQQQAIHEAWDAHGLGELPKKLLGYSGLAKLVQEHGIPLVQAWAASVNAASPTIPEGAKPWPWFCERFRAAMKRPWEWDGSRARASLGRGVQPPSDHSDAKRNPDGTVKM